MSKKVEYNYSAFSNGINNARLVDTVRFEITSNPLINYKNEDPVVKLFFQNVITAQEQSDLDNIVANHNGSTYPAKKNNDHIMSQALSANATNGWLTFSDGHIVYFTFNYAAHRFFTTIRVYYNIVTGNSFDMQIYNVLNSTVIHQKDNINGTGISYVDLDPPAIAFGQFDTLIQIRARLQNPTDRVDFYSVVIITE